ncbi:MAG: aspartate carbamoyltransferase catalytic subunit [Methylophilaceae bacterium]|jgi:aspartate carbamoyltransferase catalytic subunit|nr:aspartate carbamoyltransferase catalytic subunit [Methylophilaceae bacterium]
MSNIKIKTEINFQHLLSIEGMSKELITKIFDIAETFLKIGKHDVKKVPLLRGKTVCNLFFENSTRTRTTFEIAAKRLSADVLNLDISSSSQSKGESIIDTVNNLIAMSGNIFVIRHPESGMPKFIASNINKDVHIINAGDGNHSHPTQGLLDAFTIRKYKKSFNGLKIAIVGDIKHSRVARSEMHALSILGASEIRLVGPKIFMPDDVDPTKFQEFNEMKAGISDVDVIMMLRIQKERMQQEIIPSEKKYFESFGLTTELMKYAKKDAIVMHPGPINRGVEIQSQVADSSQSVILAQVTFGIAIRMAVMTMLIDKNI